MPKYILQGHCNAIRAVPYSVIKTGDTQMTTAAALHLSLARDDICRARQFFNQAATDAQLNQDQIDYVIDCAHDFQRDARRHIEAAVRS